MNNQIKKVCLSILVAICGSSVTSAQNVFPTDGNVGIGTVVPPQQLSLTGGIGFANQNATDKKLFSPVDGLLEWWTHAGAMERGFAISHQGDRRVLLSVNGDSYLNGGNVGSGQQPRRSS